MTVSQALRRLLVLAALLALAGACDRSGEVPRQSSQEFLERRRMATSVVELAEKAIAADDPLKAAATYELLIELWPDLPEARTGGAWRSAAIQARRLSSFSRQLEAQRRQGLALQDRLAETSETLEAMRATLGPLVGSSGAPEDAAAAVGRSAASRLLEAASRAAAEGMP